MSATITSSTGIVQQGQASVYPDGMRRLPQVLGRINRVRHDLLELAIQALDFSEEAERLDQELAELKQFVETRVEINRQRERRRERHRNGHSNNGHTSAISVNGGGNNK